MLRNRVWYSEFKTYKSYKAYLKLRYLTYYYLLTLNKGTHLRNIQITSRWYYYSALGSRQVPIYCCLDSYLLFGFLSIEWVPIYWMGFCLLVGFLSIGWVPIYWMGSYLFNGFLSIVWVPIDWLISYVLIFLIFSQ